MPYFQKAVVNGSYLARQYLSKNNPEGNGGLLINISSMAGQYNSDRRVVENMHSPPYFNVHDQGLSSAVVWYLASGAQGPRINTWLGHSRLG